mgnify:CR=1 FL=1
MECGDRIVSMILKSVKSMQQGALSIVVSTKHQIRNCRNASKESMKREQLGRIFKIRW